MVKHKKFVSNFKGLRSKKFSAWLVLTVMVFGLAVMVSRVQQVQIWISQAVGKEAHLVVPTQYSTGEMRLVWNGVGQGLEGDETMLQPVEDLGRKLGIRFVRVDHVLNNYDVVSKNGNQLEFNFERLDQLVRSIMSMGAKPVLVLSYMPLILSIDGTVEGAPRDWGEWEQLIEAVIKHYSTDEGMGIGGVYYEVWNEPDLFGKWKNEEGTKYYYRLYEHTAIGAARVKNAEKFYLGGPATTGMYPNWIKKLVKEARSNHWQLDFISWHRYSENVDDFVDDVRWVRNWAEKEGIENLQLLITEWGLDSNLHPGNDSQLAAAHGVAVVRQVASEVDGIWPFELKDGLDPEGKRYWGRWGMVTHEEAGLVEKPRFRVWKMLNELDGERLLVLGEGSWVTALGSKDKGGIIRLVITNYDRYEEHREMVPVDFLGLELGKYSWRLQRLDGKEETGEATVTTGIWRKMIYLDLNEVVLLELEKQSVNLTS